MRWKQNWKDCNNVCIIACDTCSVQAKCPNWVTHFVFSFSIYLNVFCYLVLMCSISCLSARVYLRQRKKVQVCMFLNKVNPNCEQTCCPGIAFHSHLIKTMRNSFVAAPAFHQFLVQELEHSTEFLCICLTTV